MPPFTFPSEMTTPQRNAAVVDYCAATGWTAEVRNPNTGGTMSNPVTQQQWFQSGINAHVKQTVKAYREQQDAAAAAAAAAAQAEANLGGLI